MHLQVTICVQSGTSGFSQAHAYVDGGLFSLLRQPIDIVVSWLQLDRHLRITFTGFSLDKFLQQRRQIDFPWDNFLCWLHRLAVGFLFMLVK